MRISVELLSYPALRAWTAYKKHFMGEGRLLETQNATLSVIIGFVFILNTVLNGTLYERYPATYHYMAFLPSWIWGILYASFGILHLSLLYAGFHWFRKQIILIKCGLWVFLALCTLSSDLFSPAGWVFLVFAFSAGITFLRIELTEDGLPTHDNVNDVVSGS